MLIDKPTTQSDPYSGSWGSSFEVPTKKDVYDKVQTLGGSGTVTSASVVSSNGFTGSVATATTTPAITLTTSVTGILKGDGTALSTATAPDFPTLNQNTTGNAATATTLQTARNINGVSFNGSADINIVDSTKVTGNAAITGATKTKITYDAKGLVTAGADATTADIADSLNKRYVTDADLLDLANLSGINTGDQTNISGNAATVTTNANLTGPITSVGNATSVASQTGTGSTFVMNTSPTLVTPAIGTPSSGTLTNCTGLPIAGLVASTSTAIGVGSVELGHATDTTITRSSAGVIAVEGAVIPSTSSTNTLTNKRITKRAPAVTQAATPAINTDITDVAHITGLAQAITSFTTNLTGTPGEGDMLRIDITDNGTARAITWGASFEASTVVLPTTTVASTRLDVVFVWNTATSKWRCTGVA